MGILGSGGFEDASPYKKFIQDAQKALKDSRYYLGKEIPGCWTPIGRARDYSTASDPKRAKWLCKYMAEKGREENRWVFLDEALEAYKKFKNK